MEAGFLNADNRCGHPLDGSTHHRVAGSELQSQTSLAAALCFFIPPATTASVARPVTTRRSRKWATPVRWVGIHQILLSCHVPERATAIPGPCED